MAFPIGLPNVALPDGNYDGPTPEGFQRWFGSSFMNSGVLPGQNQGTVVGTTDWAYKVYAGTAFMWSSFQNRTGIMVPFEDTELPVTANGSMERTDLIWLDGSGVLRVTEGVRADTSTVPSGIIIDRIVLPANAPSTKSGISNWDKNYAIPTGASLGLLHKYHDPQNANYGLTTPQTLGTGRFVLPSDRLVSIDLTFTGSAEQTSKGGTGVANWNVFIDGQPSFARNFHYSGIHPTTHYQSVTLSLLAGAHTIHYVQKLQTGERWRYHKGGPDNWLGSRFEVWDRGPSV